MNRTRPLPTRLLALVLGLALALPAGLAQAAVSSATSTLSASLTITANCNVSSTNQVNFGSVNPADNRNAPGTGSVSVKCAKGLTIRDIQLDAGSHFSGGTRHMSDGSSSVPYSLYTDAGHTNIWGDGGTTIAGNPLNSGFSPSSGANVPQTFNVYGLVLAADQNVPPATYTDTVNITVDF